jgi:alpha-tubulin suppressor-like RCC1 family protein
MTRAAAGLAVARLAASLLAIGCQADARAVLPRPAPGLVSGGAGHTCAIVGGGTVACWGSNPDGQLGDDTQIDSPQPTSVTELTGVIQVSAGSYHTCALAPTNGRHVLCWGWNVGGQIGDGGNTNHLAPFEVAGLSGVRGIATGSYHSCALLADGSARCWGQNDSGQLGSGSTANSGTPVNVFSLPPSTALAAGGRHSCALVDDGSVQCWGANDSGELGNGTTTGHELPEPVTGVAGAIAIASGFNHVCALLDDGTGNGSVVCWGSNQYGQLGNDSTTDSATAVAVAGLGPVLAIAAGYNHTCALLRDASARCWGWNAAGQLGDGTTTDRRLPTAIVGLSNVIAIAGGGFHTCAAATGGTISCWGSNDSGQLGDGTTENHSTPVLVAGIHL